ncbi:MAG: HNH endonuclease [Psychromonas sp.]
MKLSINFSDLTTAVSKMGAMKVEFTIKQNYVPRDPIDIQLDDGFEVDFLDIQFETGLASYEGRQVLLYIKDHSYKNRFEQAIENGKMGNRYHVADCSKLEEMRKKGKLERYVVTNKLDGLFKISRDANEHREAQEGDAKLQICQFCLDAINYKGFKNTSRGPKRQNFVENFNLSDFFDTYSSFFKFMPSGIADNQQEGYSDDWQQVSNSIKSKYQFVCQQCAVDLKSNKRLLQTHHKNGVKADNTDANLTPLCVDCHRKQPLHTHLFVPHKDTQSINRLRQAQNLNTKENWRDIYNLADSGMGGVINMLENHHLPMPEVGLEVSNDQHEVVSELELAWPMKKVGVAVDRDSAIAATKVGWKVFSMRHALSLFDDLANRVR